MIRTTVLASLGAVCALVAVPSAASASNSGPSSANVVVTISGASGGAARAHSSGSFMLRATVPVSCWVEPTSIMTVSEGSSGSVVEACNNPGGFTVSASYRSLKPTETASVVYGDQAHRLSGLGLQALYRSNVATIRRVNYIASAM